MSKLSQNYILLSEGKMSRAEFVRQARQMHPGVISQLNSFEDAIRILRNRGLLTEEVIYQCKADKFPLEAIDRGIRYELEEMGAEPTQPTEKEYKEAKRRTVENLSKDPLHYLVLLGGKKNVKPEYPSDKMEKVTLKENKEKVSRRMLLKEAEEKKALKAIVMKLIPRILSEAATTNLANFSDKNASVAELPGLINSLENIVTEIESFWIKEQQKIQGIFDSIGTIKNEDGIPVGYKFSQPVLESLKADIQPVFAKISLEGIQLPSAPAQDSELPGEELSPEDEKQTVFSPAQSGIELTAPTPEEQVDAAAKIGTLVKENKQFKRRYTR